jgi:MFS family permease
MNSAPASSPEENLQASPEPLAELPAPPHPLTVSHFRNLWIGSTISIFGDQLYLVALPWLVLQLTGSSLLLGTILMTAAIPRTCLMLVGGALTDRVTPRRVLLATSFLRVVLVAAMGVLVWFDQVQIWHIYVLTAAFGIANGFAIPAAGSLVPTLVKPQQLQRANSILQGSMVMTQTAGQAPAGFLIRAWGVAPALLLDALSFLGVIAALFRMPDPPKLPQLAGAPTRPNMLESIKVGVRAVWNDPPLRSLMIVFAALNFCVAGPIGVGLPTMVRYEFGSPALFGILLACFSGGTMAGMLLCGLVKRPRRRGLKFIAVGMLAGLVLISIGLLNKAALIGAALAVMGLGVGFINVHFHTWVQMRTERALLGRVLSIVMLVAVGLLPFSYAICGVIAQWSIRGLFIGAGILLTTLCFVMALISRAAREID